MIRDVALGLGDGVHDSIVGVGLDERVGKQQGGANGDVRARRAHDQLLCVFRGQHILDEQPGRFRLLAVCCDGDAPGGQAAHAAGQLGISGMFPICELMVGYMAAAPCPKTAADSGHWLLVAPPLV